MKNKKPTSQKIETISCFRNSDGFITESEVIAKRRQKVLNKFALKDWRIAAGKEKESFMCGDWLKSHELKKAERTPSQIKRDIILDLQDREDRENTCLDCNGRGDHDECGYQGHYKVGCSTCDGTGFTREYRESKPDRRFLRK